MMDTQVAKGLCEFYLRDVCQNVCCVIVSSAREEMHIAQHRRPLRGKDQQKIQRC